MFGSPFHARENHLSQKWVRVHCVTQLILPPSFSRARKGEGWFKVKHRQKGNICTIMDTFAEMFPKLETSPANPSFYIYNELNLCYEDR